MDNSVVHISYNYVLSNQQISHFLSFNSTRKVNIDESFGSPTFKPDTALPNVKLLGFLPLQFRRKFICLHVFR